MNRKLAYCFIGVFWMLTASKPVISGEQIRLSIGGKMEQYFFVVDKRENENLTGALTDAELYFTGSTILDNGIKIEARIEVEAETGGKKNVDEQFLDITGVFGVIRIGESEGFNHSLSYEVPYVAYSDDEIVGRIIPSRMITTIKDGLTFERFTGDSFQLGVQSRPIKGLTLAANFFPTTREGQDRYVDRSAEDYNAWEFTGKWSGRISRAQVGLVMGYFGSRSSLDRRDGERAWNISSQIKFGGLNIGGTFIKTDPRNNQSNKSFGIGSTYNIAGYGFGLSYMNVTGKGPVMELCNDKLTQFKMETSILISKGVKFGVSGFWAGQRGLGSAKVSDMGVIGSAILRF